MDWTILSGVGAALIRSIIGWAKNSVADGYVNDYEWKQLGETIVRVGLIGLVVGFWPNLDVSFFEAAAIALGGDLVLEAVKKLGWKKK